MKPATLRRICRGVWGTHWQRELARAVGRCKETVYAWNTGKSRMSKKDHWRILEAAKLHSKARHKLVLTMVAYVKNRPPSGCIVQPPRKRIKKTPDPIPPWKYNPQQLVATREFFAQHARPKAFHVKQTENIPAPQQDIEVIAQTPPPTPLEDRPREKLPGWVVETG